MKQGFTALASDMASDKWPLYGQTPKIFGHGFGHPSFEIPSHFGHLRTWLRTNEPASDTILPLKGEGGWSVRSSSGSAHEGAL